MLENVKNKLSPLLMCVSGVYTILCMVYSVLICFASAIVVAKGTIGDDVKPEGILAAVLVRVDRVCSYLFCCKRCKTSSKC